MSRSNNQAFLVMAAHHEERGEPEKALYFYRKHLASSPSAEIHERAGRILRDMGDLEGARNHFENALSMDGGRKQSIYALAVMERIRGDYDSSMGRYLKLKSMGVEDAGVDMSMGVLLSETGEIHEALEHYEAAFRKNPENKLVRFNLSLCLMTLGDFGRGLELYEDRIWHALPPGEEWSGEGGCNLLVSHEQGNGDIIQFARYIPMLKPLCGKVTLLCNRPLMELMGGVAGVDEVVEFNPGDQFVEVEGSSEGTASFEKFVRIMSLPFKLGLDPSKVAYGQYLKSDPSRVSEWKSRMRPARFRVGLCWQGGRRSEPEMVAIDRRRSIPFQEMAPLLSLEDVDFYSLQKDDEQHLGTSVIDLMGYSDNFSDTAALVENLDLVVTVDTAVAHLSAALGKPTWMLSRRGGCWRWGNSGESTFWYPSMRIFRQERMNEWASVIKKIAEEIHKLCSHQKK